MDRDTKNLIKEFKELEKVDIHKMSVAEFADASEGNSLWKANIWTKAYKMEEQIKELKADNAKLREYVEHKTWPDKEWPNNFCEASKGNKCNCGLDTLLEQTSQSPNKE